MPSHSHKSVAPFPAHYFPALTGIRAVAAFFVLLFHFNPFTYADQHSVAARWANYFIQQLHIGVPIFFVLSGFLITHRYINSVELTPAWVKNYLWNRFTRIYPVYFILTVVTFLVLQYTPDANAGAWHSPDFSYKDKLATIVLNITLLKSFFKAYLTTGIPTAWSLTVEECFYILAPFILITIRHKKLRLLTYSFTLLGIGILLVYVASLIPNYLYGFMKSMNFMLRFTLFGRCVEFMSGVALALYISKSTSTALSQNRFTSSGIVGIISCIIVLAVIKYNHLPTEAWPTSAWSIIVQNIILPLFIASLLYGLIAEDTVIKRTLSTGFFSILGKSSYALYLIHLGPLDNAFTYYISGSVLLKVIFYYISAIIIFKFIEEPIRIRLRNNKPFHFSLSKPHKISQAT